MERCRIPVNFLSMINIKKAPSTIDIYINGLRRYIPMEGITDPWAKPS